MHFAPRDGKTAGAQMREWIAKYPHWTVVDKEHIVIPEPVEHALEAVRTQLWSIEKAVRDKYGIKEFTDVSVILSGPGNYRNALAGVELHGVFC